MERLHSSLTARRLDASHDSHHALHDGYILCHGDKDNPTVIQSEAKNSEKTIVLIMRTFVLLSCQRQGRGGIQRGRVAWSNLATSGNLPRCVATRGKRFKLSFRKKAGGQLENFATFQAITKPPYHTHSNYNCPA
ncbi:MAG: hypothetical protein IJW31_03290 [Lentisphaeria bacterium]|nr:hypothetical protein [Lentisphaeria bacterium]